jgi:hypothetical protein
MSRNLARSVTFAYMRRRVRDRRSSLVALYAGLVLLGHAIHALPGLPEFRSSGEHAFWFAVDLLLILLIARGSRAAVTVALAFDVLGLVLLATGLAGAPEPGVAAFFGAILMQAIVLFVLRRDASVGMPAAADVRNRPARPA